MKIQDIQVGYQDHCLEPGWTSGVSWLYIWFQYGGIHRAFRGPMGGFYGLCHISLGFDSLYTHRRYQFVLTKLYAEGASTNLRSYCKTVWGDLPAMHLCQRNNRIQSHRFHRGTVKIRFLSSRRLHPSAVLWSSEPCARSLHAGLSLQPSLDDVAWKSFFPTIRPISASANAPHIAPRSAFGAGDPPAPTFRMPGRSIFIPSIFLYA